MCRRAVQDICIALSSRLAFYNSWETTAVPFRHFKFIKLYQIHCMIEGAREMFTTPW
jgi:hypothetical protein